MNRCSFSTDMKRLSYFFKDIFEKKIKIHVNMN